MKPVNFLTLSTSPPAPTARNSPGIAFHSGAKLGITKSANILGDMVNASGAMMEDIEWYNSGRWE